MVLFFYGGSWSRGDRRDYAFAGRALAARGYTVVLPDYRVLPEVEYPVFLQDCAAALRWTRENIAAYGGDPAAAALMGHSSAGAYNAVMLALDRGLGVSDIPDVVVGLSGPYDFFPFGREDHHAHVRRRGRRAGNAADQPRLVGRAADVPGARRSRQAGLSKEHRGACRPIFAMPASRSRNGIMPASATPSPCSSLADFTFLGGKSGLLDDVTAFLGRHLL